MIVGQIHEGSGLGNQLFTYVMTRVLAADLGVDFGFEGQENFKGKDFMPLDWGKQPEFKYEFTEQKTVNAQGVDIRGYDKRVKTIRDGTKIEGIWQSERYFNHRLDEVREWLKVLPCEVPEKGCIINFRGGEYKNHPDLFLTKEYWDTAIMEMEIEQPDVLFHVVTDDPEEAKKFFPKFSITHDLEIDYRLIQSAPYLILSNSSFAIFPALLGNAIKIIAPKNWARRNIGIQSTKQNIYKRFTHV